MRYFPIFVDLENQACLVVGAGDIAERKIRLLLKSPARVDVIAPAVNAEIAAWMEAGQVRHIGERFDALAMAENLAHYRLVIAATDDAAVNAQVASVAKQANVLCNVVDTPELCDYITPSIVDRDPVTIAISSAGEAPVLARNLRAQIESLVPVSLGKLASAIGRFRDKHKPSVQFWDRALKGVGAERAAAGDSDAAMAAWEAELSNHSERGEVYLVGAGPGDPDLLTLKALQLMQEVDVVVYDRLVSDGVMEKVRRDADRIYVGKRRDQHTMAQEDINQLLVDLAKQGKRVLRLKGGDPFVFARGGEEIELLAENHVAFQVVPGITAATGCAAYSGIPLTHRDHAQSVRFVTGHRKDGSLDLDWEALARPEQTLVFYMGLGGLSTLCEKLIEYGLPTDFPVAIVERGTRPDQRVFTGKLKSFAAVVSDQGVKPPTLIIVGNVVKVYDQMHGKNQ